MNAQGDVVAQHVVLPLHIGGPFPACCATVLPRRRHCQAVFLIDLPVAAARTHRIWR